MGVDGGCFDGVHLGSAQKNKEREKRINNADKTISSTT